jgi:hypothetical protein
VAAAVSRRAVPDSFFGMNVVSVFLMSWSALNLERPAEAMQGMCLRAPYLAFIGKS